MPIEGDGCIPFNESKDEAKKIAAYHIRKGANNFKEFSSKMNKDLGDGIKPHLKELYESGKKYIDELTNKHKKQIIDKNKLNNRTLSEDLIEDATNSLRKFASKGIALGRLPVNALFEGEILKGTNKFDTALDNVTRHIQKYYPEIEKRDIQLLYSKFRASNYDEKSYLDEKNSEFKNINRLKLKIEKAKEQIDQSRNPKEIKRKTEEVVRLNRILREELKRINIPAKSYTSYMDATAKQAMLESRLSREEAKERGRNERRQKGYRDTTIDPVKDTPEIIGLKQKLRDITYNPKRFDYLTKVLKDYASKDKKNKLSNPEKNKDVLELESKIEDLNNQKSILAKKERLKKLQDMADKSRVPAKKNKLMGEHSDLNEQIKEELKRTKIGKFSTKESIDNELKKINDKIEDIKNGVESEGIEKPKDNDPPLIKKAKEEYKKIKAIKDEEDRLQNEIDNYGKENTNEVKEKKPITSPKIRELRSQLKELDTHSKIVKLENELKELQEKPSKSVNAEERRVKRDKISELREDIAKEKARITIKAPKYRDQDSIKSAVKRINEKIKREIAGEKEKEKSNPEPEPEEIKSAKDKLKKIQDDRRRAEDLTKQIERLEKNAPKEQKSSPKEYSEKVKKLEQERDRLAESASIYKSAFGDTSISDEEYNNRAIRAYKRMKEVSELRKKENNFSKELKNPRDRVKNDELIIAQNKAREARNEEYNLMNRFKHEGAPAVVRVGTIISSMIRANVISGVDTLTRIASFGATSFIEDTFATLGKSLWIPLLEKITGQNFRGRFERMVAIPDAIQGLKDYLKGLEEFANIVKTGKPKGDIPYKAYDNSYIYENLGKIGKAIELYDNTFSRLHAAFKFPNYYKEFTRLESNQIKYYQDHGIEITPTRIEAIRLKAQEKALEANLTQPNTFAKYLKELGDIPAEPDAKLMAKFLVGYFTRGIIKIPLNHIVRISDFTLGLLRVIGKVGMNYFKGEAFTEEQKFNMLRQATRGTLGITAVLAGLAFNNQLGLTGFGKKKNGEDEESIEGHKIIASLLKFSPIYIALQIGATMRNTFGDNTDKSFSENTAKALYDSTLGIVRSVPIVGQLISLGYNNISRQIASFVIPRFISSIAKYEDLDYNNNPNKRQVHSLQDAFMEGIPGMRQQLPLK